MSFFIDFMCRILRPVLLRDKDSDRNISTLLYENPTCEWRRQQTFLDDFITKSVHVLSSFHVPSFAGMAENVKGKWFTYDKECLINVDIIIQAINSILWRLSTPDANGWRKLRGVSLAMGNKGVTSCIFGNVSYLTRAVMENPNRAACFARSQWTVVLLGSSSWAAGIVHTAVTLGLYDQVNDGIIFG